MNFNSFSTLFFSVTLILIFSLCVFIPTLSEYGYVSTYAPNDFNSDINISSSSFLWPTPRLYNYNF